MSTPPTSAPSNPISTRPDILSALHQAAVYEAALRDVYARTAPSLRASQRGLHLVDHRVAEAGDRPLSVDETATGEELSTELRDELSQRLADLPFRGFVESPTDLIGAREEPLGLVAIVSPIEPTPDGATVGIELLYPNPEGWVLAVSRSDNDAVVANARSTWNS